MAFVTPTTSSADIAVTLAPFLFTHCRRLAITPSLDVELQSRRPSPSITDHHRPSPRRPSPPSHHRAVLIRPSPLQSQSIAVALALSLTVHHHQRAVAPSIAVKEQSRRPSPSRSRPSLSIRLLLSSRRRSVHCCPSLLSRRRAVHRRRTTPSITIKSPLRHPLLSIAVAITVHQRRTRAIPRHPSSPRSPHAFHHRQVAIAPSITVHRCPSPL